MDNGENLLNLVTALKRIGGRIVAADNSTDTKNADCDGKWITIHPNGAKAGAGRRVHINREGKIDSKGPLADALRMEKKARGRRDEGEGTREKGRGTRKEGRETRKEAKSESKGMGGMLAMMRRFVPGLDIGEVDADRLADELPQNASGNVRRSLIMGERGAARLNPNVRALENLKVAKAMLGSADWSKLPREERVKIKLATGWEKGRDGFWRRESMEIPSQDFSRKMSLSRPATLLDILGRKHEIISAYPHLANMEIRITPSDGVDELGSAHYADDGSAFVEISDGILPDTALTKETLTHEIQHIIQHEEGWSVGGNISVGRTIEEAEDLVWKEENRRINAANNADRKILDDMIRSAGLTDKLNQLMERASASDMPMDEYRARRRQLLYAIPGFREREQEVHSRIAQREADFAPKSDARVRRSRISGQYVANGAYGYRRISGEVEARNASQRTDLTRTMTGKELLEDTEDIAREDQVVVDDLRKTLKQEAAFAQSGYSAQPIHGTNGQIAGWYDRNSGKVRLVKGVATPKTIAHEIGWHATFCWAEKHHPELHRKLVQYAKNAPAGITKSVRETYGADLSPNELLDEIGAERFTRENISPLLQMSEKIQAHQFFDRVEQDQDELRAKFVQAHTKTNTKTNTNGNPGNASDLSKDELDEIAKLPPKKAVTALVAKMMEGRTLNGNYCNHHTPSTDADDTAYASLVDALEYIASRQPPTDSHPTMDASPSQKKSYFRALVAALKRNAAKNKGCGGESGGKSSARTRAPAHPRNGGGGEVVTARLVDPSAVVTQIPSAKVRQMIRDNCSLIKTVKDPELIAGIERRIKRIYERGNTTPSTVMRYLEDVCDLEPYQAERIVRDQMQKYESAAEVARMKADGVRWVRWCVGECEHHRPSHIAPWPKGLNGCVFDINHPPTDPATGEPTMPGEQIGCKCYLEAVK